MPRAMRSIWRTHGVNALLITGVNTNSANVRDYSVIVVEDCVDTMDGPAFYEAGPLCIWTAFGTVLAAVTIMTLSALGHKAEGD